jgi:hypothetical protein
MNYLAENRAETEFAAVRRRARIRRIRQLVGKSCNELSPAGRLLEKLDLSRRSDLGLQSVALERIVGSAGRYRDFDLLFQPRRDALAGRWKKVAGAQREGRKLGPIALFKVGDAYFVEDGNHRLSVARARGEATIEAWVVELDAAPLTPDSSCQRLGFKLESKRRTG